MSDATETAPEAISAAQVFSRPEALLRVPVGLASPLWGLFAGAAMTGAAWWWMTRFTRVDNLEAMFGAAEARALKVATLPVAAVETGAAAAIETLDTVEATLETQVEPAVAAVEQTAADEIDTALAAAPVEPPPGTVLEALETGAEAMAPVGGESAPISPVVADLAEAAAAAEPAKIRRKPKAD